jgi:hypothetical protein
MTVVLVSGGLTFVVGLLILRPFSAAGGRLHARAHTPDDDRRRELLRQLRDLDDDLAAGKLTQADHVRLRDPVEREAAAVLRRKTQGQDQAAGTAVVTPGVRSGPVTSGPPQGRGGGGGVRSRSGRTVTLLALAAAGSITFLFVGAVSSRHPGQTITGNQVAGVTPSASGSQSPTPQELAAVAAAEAQVKQNPKEASAHLALADATWPCWRRWPWIGACPAAPCVLSRGSIVATRPPVICCGWPAALSPSCSVRPRSPDRCGRPPTSAGRPGLAMSNSSA